MVDDIERIVAGLSAAQKRYPTDKAEWKRPIHCAQDRWMTFPPANVHRVLMRLCLVDKSGQLLSPGLAVRQRLIEGDG